MALSGQRENVEYVVRDLYDPVFIDSHSATLFLLHNSFVDSHITCCKCGLPKMSLEKNEEKYTVIIVAEISPPKLKSLY